MGKKKKKQLHQAPVRSVASGMEPIEILEAPLRGNFDISKWRRAIAAAEDPRDPDRNGLLDIYNDIILDAHLTSLINKRVEDLTGTRIVFTHKGKANEKISDLIDMPWFGEMLEDLLKARFYGHTASWIDLSGGEFHKYKCFSRKHIVPEKHLFREKEEQRTGIDYTQPPLDRYIITAGKERDFGLLLIAVPYALIKRGDVSDWATFNELFSAPFRVGTYPAFNPAAKKEMAEALKTAGGFGYALIQEGTKLDFVQNSGTGSAGNYQALADFCDKQMSKTFIHGTMTLDAEGGQYKGDIHERSEDAVHKSDRRFILNVLNTSFKYLLEIHGFNPGEGKFSFVKEEHICLKDRLDMDLKISAKIKVPASYWYETYNMPVPEGGPQDAEPPVTNIPSGDTVSGSGKGKAKHSELPDDPRRLSLYERLKDFFA